VTSPSWKPLCLVVAAASALLLLLLLAAVVASRGVPMFILRIFGFGSAAV